MPSEQHISEIAEPTPLAALRHDAFRSRCAAELRRAYDYVTVFPEAGDEGVDILVQNEAGEPIPVHCSPEAITGEDIQRFADSLLIRAFRRGLVLTGNGHGRFAAWGYPSDVSSAADSLRRRGITIRLLSLTELELLDWE